METLDDLRRAAKQLRKAYEAGQQAAVLRVKTHPPRGGGATLRHADFLHIIANERRFASWPALKLAVEVMGLDRAGKLQKLKVAVAHGNHRVVAYLLQDTPDLARGVLGLEIALYDLAAVETALARDPGLAVAQLGPRSAMAHLCFSRHIHAQPELHSQMLQIAELLLAHGADVNDAIEIGGGHKLSVLYGALGHANNMALSAWLLEHGADPNDGESLYHATELGHHRGLELLLKAGAQPAGTNALPRALDFDDLQAVKLLLDAGADVNEFNGDDVGGERPWVVPALHQAARRGCSLEVVQLLLGHGARLDVRYQGATALDYACVFGQGEIAELLSHSGAQQDTSSAVETLIRIEQGLAHPDERIAERDLPLAFHNLIRTLIPLSGQLPYIRRLIAHGLPFDAPDEEGLTPVQVAGWEGLPDEMAFFMSLGPDLSHVNGYGGTLVSTILHGAENCPAAGRDHLVCLNLALEAGVPIPEGAESVVQDPALAERLLQAKMT